MAQGIATALFLMFCLWCVRSPRTQHGYTHTLQASSLPFSLVHFCTTPNVLEATFSHGREESFFQFPRTCFELLFENVGVGGVTDLGVLKPIRISDPFVPNKAAE